MQENVFVIAHPCKVKWEHCDFVDGKADDRY